MAWFVAVCFPGLLMLSTVGLQRLESLLHSDRPTATDFVARLEQLARAAREAAREHTGPLPLKNISGYTSRFDGRLPLDDEPGLPTRLYAHASPNPQFQPTRYGNSV